MVKIPDTQQGDKVALRIAKALMSGIGSLLELWGSDAWVLGLERRGDDEHLVQASVLVGCQQHPSYTRRYRPSRQGAADESQASSLIDGFDLAECLKSLADALGPGWIEPCERFDVIDSQRLCVQDRRGQIAAHDLGLSKPGAAQEVLFVVESDGDTGSQPPAAATALVC